jgi:hypothetical protein
MAQPVFISRDWHDRVRRVAVIAARESLAAVPPHLMLSDENLGKLVDSVLKAWITLRAEQAVANGVAFEQLERLSGQYPEPWDTAIIGTVLPQLAELPIDWSKPLTAWTKDEMSKFICRALDLACRAQSAAQRGSAGEFSDTVPF